MAAWVGFSIMAALGYLVYKFGYYCGGGNVNFSSVLIFIGILFVAELIAFVAAIKNRN